MLSKADLKFGYRLFSICSFLALIPFEFYPETFRMETSRSRMRYIMFCMSLCAGWIYTLYTFFSFLFIVMFGRPSLEELNVIIVQWAFSVGFISSMFWGVQLFVRYSQLTAAIFNRCNYDLKATSPQWATKTEQERLLQLLPYGEAMLLIVFTVMYVFTDESPKVYLSAVPNGYRNNLLVVVVVTIAEIYSFAVILSAGLFKCFTELLFFNNVFNQLQKSLAVLRWRRVTRATLVREVRKCREIQLKVAMFNVAFSYSIYAMKLMALGMVIPGLSFALKFHFKTPVASANNALYGLYVCALFITIYDKAFQMPEKVNHVKKGIFLAAKATIKARDVKLKKEILLTLRSVPEMRIKAGDFDYFERKSTPAMVDFVVSRTCSFLIGLKK